MAIRAALPKPEDQTSKNILQFKLILLGEVSVGKSCLVIKFVKGHFPGLYENTISLGATYFTKTIDLNDVAVKFEIWDTAGQERYHSLLPMIYRGAQGAIVVYDITNQASFEKAKSWVKELQEQAMTSIVIALVGNKIDLNKKRCVQTDDAQNYAYGHGLLFMETSAKSNFNVTDIFEAIAAKLLKNETSPITEQDRRLDKSDRTNKRLISCC